MNAGSAASTVLVLIRHGEAESNFTGRIGGHSSTPLTELGRRQARATAQALREALAPTVVISSDLVRARETAEPIGAALGLDIRLDPRLRERSLGIMDGLSFEEAAAAHPAEWQRLRERDPLACPPGGETVHQVFERVSQAIDDIAHTFPGERVAVVSHGIAIYHAFAHICGLGSPAGGLKVFTLVDNCSISTFTFHRNHWLLSALNDRAHLRQLT